MPDATKPTLTFSDKIYLIDAVTDLLASAKVQGDEVSPEEVINLALKSFTGSIVSAVKQKFIIGKETERVSSIILDVLGLTDAPPKPFTVQRIVAIFSSSLEFIFAKNSQAELTDAVTEFADVLSSFIARVESKRYDIEEDLEEKAGGGSPAFAPAPEDSILGKYAFSPSRINFARVPFEKNTKEEDRLEAELNSHFGGEEGDEKLSNWAAKTLSDIEKKGLYKDVIKEPSVDEVYRGMCVDETWMTKALEVSKEDLASMKERSGSIDKRFTYKPKQGAGSSWTIDVEVARGFADDAFRKITSEEPNGLDLNKKKKKLYKIVLVASLKDNENKFVSGPDGLYKLKGPVTYSHEKEAVGLADVKVSTVLWTRAR